MINLLSIRLTQWLFKLPKSIKNLIKISFDIILINLSFVLAIILNQKGQEHLLDPDIAISSAIVTVFSILGFKKIGFYRQIVRFITTRTLRKLSSGILLSFILMLGCTFWFSDKISWPVPFIYGLIIWFCICGSRYVFKVLFQLRSNQNKKNIALYGAGHAGLQLIDTLKKTIDYNLVALIDDKKELQNTEVAGINVYAPNQVQSLIDKKNVNSILLAMPSISLKQRRQIINELTKFPIEITTIPNIEKIISGEASVDDVRRISIDDLMQRDSAPALKKLLKKNIENKAILVTGAGGSIGGELCRQIVNLNPSKLIILDSSEVSLYTIEKELTNTKEFKQLDLKIISILGSIADPTLLSFSLQTFCIDTVYHAAAYKHVPLVEINSIDGIKNNVFGTLNLVKAAIDAQVETFVLISSDKAVRPTNIMGASKRISELICQAYSLQCTSTTFSMVRFGNVLDSSGSVVPLFRKQIEAGGPVTVTHPEINRFFMTMAEAAQLVLQSSSLASGGDVFILDMGEPIKITELAEKMIRLSGLTPYYNTSNEMEKEDGDIEIIFSGLRKGEKLYEELLIGENSDQTAHSRIFTAKEQALDMAQLESFLHKLEQACENRDEALLREILIDIPIDYQPSKM